MQPLKVYDYLALARQRVFEWVRPISPEDYARLGVSVTDIDYNALMYKRRAASPT